MKRSGIAIESVPPEFIPGWVTQTPRSSGDLLLIIHKDTLLFTPDGQIPVRAFAEKVLPADCAEKYLGALNGIPCYYFAVPELPSGSSSFRSMDIRTILCEQEPSIFHLCCRALHLLAWRKKHNYCGVCAALLADKTDELARVCQGCGLIVYPRISPAVIVAVIRDNSILLARSRGWRLNFHSVLAGFVEPGETLEECVRREVFEETSIIVKNIRYFGSEPWPFPDSLMAGFIADFAGGELRIDELELETADWFRADNMPKIPDAPSISRKLIDWFIASQARP